MADLCPCCGQVLPWKKEAWAKEKAGAKLLKEDVSKAEASINALTMVVQNPRSFYGWGEEPSRRDVEALREAALQEIVRLRKALLNNNLLWSIYRIGNNKGLLSYS